MTGQEGIYSRSKTMIYELPSYVLILHILIATLIQFGYQQILSGIGFTQDQNNKPKIFDQ